MDPTNPLEAMTSGAQQVETLIGQLTDPDGRRRLQARATLIDIGRAAVPPLLRALQSRDERLRWESAKALGEIADPSATAGLLEAMLDEEPEIRWLAAEALSAIGWPAIEPLLHALVQMSGRTLFRLGAHMVLRTIEERDGGEVLRPVIKALEGVEPAMAAPIAAQEVLIRLMNDRFRAA